MHPYIVLAHKAIATYLQNGQIIAEPNPLPRNMTRPAAVFVSLHTADGLLRGCRGTTTPTQPTLANEIIYTAVASAVDDPRFPPMTLAEMKGLDIKIDILSEFEPVSDRSQLDEKLYGVFIRAGERRALLLPDIEAVKNVDHQLELVRRKAGLDPHESVQLYRFTVTRYTMED